MPAALCCPCPLPLLLICYLFQTLIVCMQSPFDDFSQLSPSPLFCFLSFPPSLLFYSFLLSPSLSLLSSPFLLSPLFYSFLLSPSVSLLSFLLSPFASSLMSSIFPSPFVFPL